MGGYGPRLEVLMRTLSIIQTLVTAAATALLVGMAGLVTSATPAAAATGYWLGGDDGGVFSFNAPYNGNLVFGGQIFGARQLHLRPGMSDREWIIDRQLLDVGDCRPEPQRLQ